MARWRVTVHFKLADSEKISSVEYVVEDEGRRRIDDWQKRSAASEYSLDFPTADGARQFFSSHTVRRLDMRPA